MAADIAFAEQAERAAHATLVRELTVGVVGAAATVTAVMAGAPAWFALVPASVTQLLAGRTVLASGARAVRRRAPDMNTLIALGSTAAWGAGLLGTLGWEPLGAPAHHLEAGAMTIAFTLLGRFLESRARARAGSAVRALLDLTPPTARVLRRGEERVVPLDQIAPGNLVLLRPGERVPVDGVVMTGTTEVDESMLTGESRRVERRPGDVLHAGTLNGLGAVTLKAERIGTDSALGRITAAVRAAQGSRAEAQRTADRISAVFVPGVLVLAALSLALWLALGAGLESALVRTIAVLVVACPCALGLATPTAILVAGDRGAREGCLFRGASALERMARVDTVVFDKTGTLTRGEPVLERIVALRGTEADALRLAAAVERGSEQPLAAAVLAAAEARGLAIPHAEDVTAEPGRGIRGTVEGESVWLGSPRAARESGLAELDAHLAPLEEAGETPVVLLVAGEPVALLGFRDALRDGSIEAVRSLRALGLEPHLVSGDHPSVTRRVALELGIEHERGAARPEEKAEILRELSRAGRRTLMAGDGINDALALTTADVGIAFGGGADVAIEAADGALLADDPTRLPVLIRLARLTLRTIHQNLAWAFGYNLIALPVAAGALAPWTDWTLPPQAAAAAMAGSSLVVVLNSLRLRWARLEG